MNKFGALAKVFFKGFSVIIVLIVIGYIVVQNYGYIFSRNVVGTIVKVERVELNVAIMQGTPGQSMAPELYSFAVAIKDDKSGEIVVGSSEDRRWAVVQTGQCAEARFFPYPPWRLDKSGTYYGAKLVKLSECPAKSQ